MDLNHNQQPSNPYIQAGFVSNVDFRLDSDFVESFYKESDTNGYSDLVAFSYIRGGEPYKLLVR